LSQACSVSAAGLIPEEDAEEDKETNEDMNTLVGYLAFTTDTAKAVELKGSITFDMFYRPFKFVQFSFWATDSVRFAQKSTQQEPRSRAMPGARSQEPCTEPEPCHEGDSVSAAPSDQLFCGDAAAQALMECNSFFHRESRKRFITDQTPNTLYEVAEWWILRISLSSAQSLDLFKRGKLYHYEPGWRLYEEIKLRSCEFEWLRMTDQSGSWVEHVVGPWHFYNPNGFCHECNAPTPTWVFCAKPGSHEGEHFCSPCWKHLDYQKKGWTFM
jgi:hypothetical protein